MLIETDLTVDECYELVTSMDYTIQKFQNYTGYPSYEFKQERIAEAKAIRAKVRAILVQIREHHEKQES